MKPNLKRYAELLACILGALAAYAFLGWQESVALMLAMIMMDLMLLRQRIEEQDRERKSQAFLPSYYWSYPTRTCDSSEGEEK